MHYQLNQTQGGYTIVRFIHDLEDARLEVSDSILNGTQTVFRCARFEQKYGKNKKEYSEGQATYFNKTLLEDESFCETLITNFLIQALRFFFFIDQHSVLRFSENVRLTTKSGSRIIALSDEEVILTIKSGMTTFWGQLLNVDCVSVHIKTQPEEGGRVQRVYGDFIIDRNCRDLLGLNSHFVNYWVLETFAQCKANSST
ncbi:MAG: hypothetical protein ACRCYY_15300 [Trueperaceae bacterium]